ncbi:rod shape-determining protein MreC [candidate division WOR-3 bacterium]|nr:rod shape-determining protein MreC [candidate division WOR-3 bacterium]
MQNSRKISVWFIILIFICIVLIGFGKTLRGIRVQSQLASVFSPFQKYTLYFFNALKIKQENKILRQKVSMLALENQQLTGYKYENEKLASLLGFKAQSSCTLLAARIISRSQEPISGTCLIDKGKMDGIERDLPVVVPDGVYGKVLEVTKNTAIVQTIFGFNFRVGAVDLRSGVQGIVGWEKGKGCVFEQVPVHSDIKIGDKIITSGIGSVFPKGLKIGEVSEINIDKTKLFYSVPLKPACKFSKIDYVFVMKEASESFQNNKEFVYESIGWKVSLIKDERVKETNNEKPTRFAKDSARRDRNKREKKRAFSVKFKAPEPVIRPELRPTRLPRSDPVPMESGFLRNKRSGTEPASPKQSGGQE